MEMAMKAMDDIYIRQDMTPPLPPLTCSLHDSVLSSHCSSCFLPLPSSSSATSTSTSLRHCSSCSASASASLHLLSGELHLLDLYHGFDDDTSELRAALRLLHMHRRALSAHSGRLLGLLANRMKVMEDEESCSRIRRGARAMKTARAMAMARRERTESFDDDVSESREGEESSSRIDEFVDDCWKLLDDDVTDHRKVLDDEESSSRIDEFVNGRRELLEGKESSGSIRIGARGGMRDGRKVSSDDGRGETESDCELEEAVLCLVITNGVEISVDGGKPIGIGVYDWRFSWINHSCSPNSFYRFVRAFELDEEGGNDNSMRIEPFDRVADQGVLAEGDGNYGPRVVVRSIKPMQRGEEATITYIDLLQPTTPRQSELSLKFQFICSCRRCSSMPPAYVDYALQETFFTLCQQHNLGSPINHSKENAVERLRDLFDMTITEYMELGDPVLCSEKIETLLSQGVFDQHLEESRRASHTDFRLSPLHYLSLNAYTTLSSTYRICASQSPEGGEAHSFDMSRISAGYSLLLAGATYHLFSYEPSCIASAATFWIGAGESLLCLARSSYWNSVPTNCALQNHGLIANLNCPRCSLMSKFKFDFPSNQAQKREFDATSHEFLMCVSVKTPEVWSFLVRGCRYLEAIKDPIDFRWLGCMRTSSTWDLDTRSVHNSFNLDGEGGLEGALAKFERRTSIFELGIHCLLYGGYLSCICYGHNQRRTDYIRNLVHG